MISVIIADDHKILREGLKLLLETYADLQVVGQACDGEEAVRMAFELKPDLVLMDINMPNMDGIEACRRISGNLASSPVLVLSQLDSEDHLLEVLQAGARGYVLKDNAGDELVHAVRTVVGGQVYMTPLMASRLVDGYVHKEQQRHQQSVLTSREVEVIKCVARGLANRQIASSLNLSVKTVDNHRANIMRKLAAHDRVDLVKYAIRMGWVQPEG